ncbi:MAG: flavodoxin family protein [Candidatus Hermodarchaeota archaeon]
MKILAINGSPHKNGNTVKLINEIFRGARQQSHHCEIVHLIDLHLDYCNWCRECYDTGVCSIDDGFQEHLEQVFKSDLLIVATPSINRSVTGYMKNWLDRFCTSQLIYEVDDQRQVTMHSRVPRGKKAIIIVQGCTNLFQETIEPINVVMKVLDIPVIERLVVPHIGLTEDDTVDKKEDVMNHAWKIGRKLK